MNATGYKSLAEGLPPEMAKQLHPDWYKNEADYWAVRDTLLEQYRNLWIAFSDGRVVAANQRPSLLFREARDKTSHPYVACVGREEVGLRMRRSVFAYDTSYPGESMPVVRAEFQSDPAGPPVVLDQIILDTGSDSCSLPWMDCQLLHLDPNDGLPTIVAGVTGVPVRTLSFEVWITLDGIQHRCEVQADHHGTERIIGRNVLNYMDVLFRGPAAEVIINP